MLVIAESVAFTCHERPFCHPISQCSFIPVSTCLVIISINLPSSPLLCVLVILEGVADRCHSATERPQPKTGWLVSHYKRYLCVVAAHADEWRVWFQLISPLPQPHPLLLDSMRQIRQPKSAHASQLKMNRPLPLEPDINYWYQHLWLKGKEETG